MSMWFFIACNAVFGAPSLPVVGGYVAKRVVVTGGSGNAGEYVIAELASKGYEVYNADVVRPREGSPSNAAQYWNIDLTDYGEVVNALTGADAVIHLAAIIRPNQDPEHKVFRVNMLSCWNVLDAAEVHSISRICIASSMNAIGATWGSRLYQPEYLPIDESHPTRAEDAYSQSKWLGEQMADGFTRRRPGEVQIVSLRFPALWSPSTAKRYVETRVKNDPGGKRQRGFWSWVGRHDAARACRLSIEKEFGGHEAFFINSSDTNLEIPTMDAIRSEFPDVELREPIPGFSSAISIAKAQRLLGWVPEESWRDGNVLAPEPCDLEPPPHRPQWTR